jgi:hypothetical protein
MYGTELSEARQTLTLSNEVASRFMKNLGAIAPILLPPFPTGTLGRKPGFQATVLDQKYWFAKLYALVSYEEIGYSTHTRYPGYSLHFMKVFYGMYYDAMQKFIAGRMANVPQLWVTHFTGPERGSEDRVDPRSFEAVQFSVRTGATAHIQHDMPIALVTAYKTWNASPKPNFKDLKDDFIVKSEAAFTKAQAAFYIDVNDKTASPFRPEVGQLGAAHYQAVFNIQPSLPIMFQWRREAWKKAEAFLE